MRVAAVIAKGMFLSACLAPVIMFVVWRLLDLPIGIADSALRPPARDSGIPFWFWMLPVIVVVGAPCAGLLGAVVTAWLIRLEDRGASLRLRQRRAIVAGAGIGAVVPIGINLLAPLTVVFRTFPSTWLVQTLFTMPRDSLGAVDLTGAWALETSCIVCGAVLGWLLARRVPAWKTRTLPR